MMMGFGMFGGLVILLFFGVLIVGVFLLVRGMFSTNREEGGFVQHPYNGNNNSPLSPIDDLDKRYAQGEIIREQYLQIRHDLKE